MKSIITNTVRIAIEDALEDIQAIFSDEYLRSIRKTRQDYQSGKVKNLKDLFDV